jgi:hypothetical protein
LDNTEISNFVVVNIDDSCPARQPNHEKDENKDDPFHGVGFFALPDPTIGLGSFVSPWTDLLTPEPISKHWKHEDSLFHNMSSSMSPLP